MRIAMWSGPRNLSTAMMYAFGNRADFAVVDEPFYAAYLAATGLDHPMRAEILRAQARDPEKVADQCSGTVPDGKAHVYQKHMVHHIQPAFPRAWMAEVTHCFLIRHPARVIASYVAKRQNPTPEDLGFQHMDMVFDHVLSLGQTPPVIDSTMVRSDPEGTLRALCHVLGIGFDGAMLSWPEGGHPADGVWAPHWYGAVHRSTGFEASEGPLPELSGDAAQLARDALPSYERLLERALRP